jgi:hypothetical protein
MEGPKWLFVLCEVCIELLCVCNGCVEEDFVETVELTLSVFGSYDLQLYVYVPIGAQELLCGRKHV